MAIKTPVEMTVAVARYDYLRLATLKRDFLDWLISQNVNRVLVLMQFKYDIAHYSLDRVSRKWYSIMDKKEGGN